MCETFNRDCHAKHLSASRASKAPHCSGNPSGGFRRGAGSHCPSARSMSSGASFRERPLTMANLGRKNPGSRTWNDLDDQDLLRDTIGQASVSRPGKGEVKFLLFTVYLLGFPELLPSTFVFDIMFDTFWSHPTQFHLSSAWTPWLHQVTSVAPPATGLGSVAPAASAAGHPLGTHWRPQRPPAPSCCGGQGGGSCRRSSRHSLWLRWMLEDGVLDDLSSEGSWLAVVPLSISGQMMAFEKSGRKHGGSSSQSLLYQRCARPGMCDRNGYLVWNKGAIKAPSSGSTTDPPNNTSLNAKSKLPGHATSHGKSSLEGQRSQQKRPLFTHQFWPRLVQRRIQWPHSQGTRVLKWRPLKWWQNWGCWMSRAVCTVIYCGLLWLCDSINWFSCKSLRYFRIPEATHKFTSATKTPATNGFSQKLNGSPSWYKGIKMHWTRNHDAFDRLFPYMDLDKGHIIYNIDPGKPAAEVSQT